MGGVEGFSNEEGATVLASALEQIADSVMITDTEGVIKYVNDSFELLTGYSRHEVLGLKPSVVQSGRHSGAFYRRLWGNLHAGRPFRGVFINRRKDGSHYHESKTITPIRDRSGVITHFVATGRDVSDRVGLEERLRNLAYTDSLTGLPNRARFLDLLHKEMDGLEASGSQLAVLFIDLDGFKVVNDSHGHQVGDRLLVDVARRLRDTLRSPDLVARMGGDEFAVLLRGRRSVDAVDIICRKIIAALEPPFDMARASTYISASIGIARAPADGGDPVTLIKHADTAMYRAKGRGGAYQFFETEMTRAAADEFNMRNDIRRAEAASEFFLHYQPQVSLRSGAIRSVEALLRWHHPVYGVIAPGAFIPLLEETGLIRPVGLWIFGEACAQLRSWQSAGVDIPMVSINVSPTQLEDPSLGAQLAEVVARHGLEPGSVEIELVETARLAETDRVESTLRTLEAAGVRLALDDFGTGFSALTHLHRFPVHTVKIDKDFVRYMHGEGEDTRLIESIVGVARTHSLDVVAEGVETVEQWTSLQALGCGYAQGHHICRPSAPATLAAFARGCRKAPAGRPGDPERLKGGHACRASSA